MIVSLHRSSLTLSMSILAHLTSLFLLFSGFHSTVIAQVTGQPMDTLSLVIQDTSASVVITDGSSGMGAVDSKVLKDLYRIGVILPFQASDTATGNANRMAAWSTDFYMGFKAAFEEPLPGKARFEINVYDTWGNDKKLEEIISAKKLEGLDVLVGPFKVSSATILAKWAKERPTILISPYTGNNRVGIGNPNYLQLTPGLDRHMCRLFDLAQSKSEPDSKVVFLYGDTTTESSKKLLWDSLINTSPTAIKSRSIALTFKLSELDMSSFSLDSLIPGPSGVTIMLPYWEESVVQAVLRKLVAEKGERKIMLLGLPQWLDFQLIPGAHWEALNTHISSADHYESTDPQLQSLARKFRDRYAQLLNREAVWGYRCGVWTRERLEKDGARFVTFLPERTVTSNTFTAPEFLVTRNAYGEVEQVVNEAIQILRYQDGSFSLMVN